MRRRTLLGGAPMLAATLAASRLARAQGSAVLRFIPNGDLISIDPVMTSSDNVRNHAHMVFETLYGMDEQFRPRFQMLEGHVTENEGRLWRLTLRPGLQFHDGTRVLARDCVASIRRWAVRDTFGQDLMAAVDELSASDDRTIVFRLKRPYPLLPAALAKVNGYVPAIMPERLAQRDAFTAIPEAIGSGPFRYLPDERVVGARAAYAKFENYVPRSDGGAGWTAGPKIVHFDRVEYHFMPDSSTAAGAMQTGEMDWWEYAAADLLPLLRRNRQLAIAPHSPVGAMAVIRPNHLTAPFNNPAIRRAVLGAITQSDFLIAMMGTDHALWQDGVGVFSPSSPLASDAAMSVLTGPRDLDRVRREIRAAGYDGERTVVLQSTEIPTQKAMGDVGAALLKELGFNVDLISTDWGTVSQRRASKEPVERGGWSCFFTTLNGLDTIDPASHIGLRAHGGRAWFGWPESAELERLRDAWFVADDLEEQKRLGRRIQEQAMRDVPFFPLGMIHPQSARRTNLAGAVASVPVFWNVRRV